MNKLNLFRQDIHILRAIAVISVLIYHFGNPWKILQNGFLGVDLFFIISGFVVPLSLKEKKRNGFLQDLKEFIKKRILRIIPALFLCVGISSIFLSLFIPTAGSSIKVGISSLFGISNIYLLSTKSQYFNDISKLNAFLHTWSLGIEEQFYLIFQ